MRKQVLGKKYALGHREWSGARIEIVLTWQPVLFSMILLAVLVIRRELKSFG